MRNYFYSLVQILLLALASGTVSAQQFEKVLRADGTTEIRQLAATTTASAPVKTYYRYRDGNGVMSFSDRKPQRHSYELVRFDCYACKVGNSISWETTPLFKGRYEDLIAHYAREHGVSPALVKAVIHAESAFNPKARSRVGAQGLMQLMPATAKELGVSSPLDPEQNIAGGVRYLAQMLQSFNHDVRLATAAYNAGPSTVRRYQGVPNYAETRAYVERVAILARRYAAES